MAANLSAGSKDKKYPENKRMTKGQVKKAQKGNLPFAPKKKK